MGGRGGVDKGGGVIGGLVRMGRRWGRSSGARGREGGVSFASRFHYEKEQQGITRQRDICRPFKGSLTKPARGRGRIAHKNTPTDIPPMGGPEGKLKREKKVM